MFRWILILLTTLSIASPAVGAGFQLAPDLTLDITFDTDRWQAAQEPPEQIVRIVASSDGPATLEKTRRVLAFNELFIWSPESGAYLMIDVSAQKEGDKPPSARAIRNSANYAGQALEAEDGMTQVHYKTKKIKLNGIPTAYLLNAEYHRDGQPHRFFGSVGYLHPYWVYFYYNDPLKNAQDYAEMERILKTVRLQRKEGS